MTQFNEMEEAALWESTDALQVLIQYHEGQVLIGEIGGYPMGWNKNRIRELRERRINLLTAPKQPDGGYGETGGSEYAG